MIRWPTSVEPVKATLSTSIWLAMAAPAVGPNPGSMLTTPSGNPASTINSPMRSATEGVCSAGFITTVFPVASAGASFHASISIGKVPGDDLSHHADRLMPGVAEEVAVDGDGLAVNLVGPSGEIAEAADRRRHVHRLRHGNGLAVVQGFEARPAHRHASRSDRRGGGAAVRAPMRASFRHGPCSNAARAALTAFSTSAASASAIWQISSPVEGLIVAKVLPDSLAIQRLLIRSLVAETATRLARWDGTSQRPLVELLSNSSCLHDAVSYTRQYHVGARHAHKDG